jgi:CubicO group peptidase (beta-lactamase class C family)
MVQHGGVALTDPVTRYLPAGLKMPERGGRSITLRDLSTHTSGLPRLPTNLAPKDPANPYADYTTGHLNQFLSNYQLTRGIGAQYEYSNLSGGLLGHALARRAGMDYETLVRATGGRTSDGTRRSSVNDQRGTSTRGVYMRPTSNPPATTLPYSRLLGATTRGNFQQHAARSGKWQVIDTMRGRLRQATAGNVQQDAAKPVGSGC